MQLIRYLLYPFSLLYGFGVYIRNKSYDLKLLKSYEFNIPIIAIGNLEVGGSGKTPCTEFIVNFLQKNNSVASLSRGYGRLAKGFRWVDVTDDVSLCGDEPLQIKNNFPAVGVAVCEDRVLGVNIIKDFYDVIIMDDAYQHRAVKPGLSILLFDYNSLNDSRLLLPTGNFREPFYARNRADIILITKCPKSILPNDKAEIIENIKPFPHQKVLFSGIAYADELQAVLYNIDNFLMKNISTDTTILLLTGIAKAELLFTKIKTKTSCVIHHKYPDHHTFTQDNITKLIHEFEAIKSKNKIIITTQKDAMRLKSPIFEQQLLGLPLYQLSIKMIFTEEDKLILENTLVNYVNKY